jgi:hypothetical protein
MSRIDYHWPMLEVIIPLTIPDVRNSSEDCFYIFVEDEDEIEGFILAETSIIVNDLVVLRDVIPEPQLIL